MIFCYCNSRQGAKYSSVIGWFLAEYGLCNHNTQKPWAQWSTKWEEDQLHLWQTLLYKNPGSSSHYVSLGSQATVMSNQRGPYLIRTAVTHYAGHTSVNAMHLGLISCIVRLEDGVVTASHTGLLAFFESTYILYLCHFSTLGITHMRKYARGQGMRPVNYIAVHLKSGNLVSTLTQSLWSRHWRYKSVVWWLHTFSGWGASGWSTENITKPAGEGEDNIGSSQPVNVCMIVSPEKVWQHHVILAKPSPFNTNSYIMNGLLCFQSDIAGRIQIMTPATYNTDMVHPHSR